MSGTIAIKEMHLQGLIGHSHSYHTISEREREREIRGSESRRWFMQTLKRQRAQERKRGHIECSNILTI